MASCIDCHAYWYGDQHHCRQCHEMFSDIEVLEYHIKGDYCWARTAFELGLSQNDHAVWMRDEDLRT